MVKNNQHFFRALSNSSNRSTKYELQCSQVQMPLQSCRLQDTGTGASWHPNASETTKRTTRIQAKQYAMPNISLHGR